MLAVAVNPVPPSVEVMALVVLVQLPGTEPVTFTVIVHVPLIAKVPPASEIAAVPGRAVTTPPQVLLRPLGLDTSRPAGSGSSKATPLSAVVALGLAMLNVSVVTPLSGSTATPNTLLMVGGRATMVLAAAVLPLPPSNDPITEVTLFFTPAEVPVTVTVTVQVPLAGMVPPVRLMEVAAATAVRVPPQVFDCTTGLATNRPVGSASVKFAPVKAMVFVLVQREAQGSVGVDGEHRKRERLADGWRRYNNQGSRCLVAAHAQSGSGVNSSDIAGDVVLHAAG